MNQENRQKLKIILLSIAVVVAVVAGIAYLRSYLHRRYIYERLLKLEDANPCDIYELHDQIIDAARPSDVEWAKELFGKHHWRVDGMIMHMAVFTTESSDYLPWLLSLLKHENPNIRACAWESIVIMVQRGYFNPHMLPEELGSIEDTFANLVFDEDEEAKDLVLCTIDVFDSDRIWLLIASALMDDSRWVRQAANSQSKEFCDKYGFKDLPGVNDSDTREVAGWFLTKWKIIRPKLPQQLLPEGLAEETVLARLAKFAASPNPPPED